MSSYFDSKEDSYHSRSTGLLNYSGEELFSILEKSYEREPIKVKQIEGNKNIISGNGLHRYSLMRLMYLNELEKINGDEVLQEI